MLNALFSLVRPEVPSPGALSPPSEPAAARLTSLDFVIECQLDLAERRLRSRRIEQVRANAARLNAEIAAEKVADRARRDRDARRRRATRAGRSVVDLRRALEATERRIIRSDQLGRRF
jgi:hypothetical protein